MRRTRIAGLVSFVGLVTCPIGTSAPAQTPTPDGLRPAPRYTLSGVVTDSSRSPLADALVGLDVAGEVVATARTGADGRFQFQDLLPVRAALRLQRAGYHSRNVPVDLASDSTRGVLTLVLVALSPGDASRSGEVVAIQESPTDPSQRLRGFYQRRQHSRFAFFFDGEQVRQRNLQYTSEMLKMIPGAMVRASDRVGNTIRLRGCRPMLWVDGLRVPGAELDEMAHPSDVAALEIYPSLGSIPPQFADQPSKCGSIVVWMR